MPLGPGDVAVTGGMPPVATPMSPPSPIPPLSAGRTPAPGSVGTSEEEVQALALSASLAAAKRAGYYLRQCLEVGSESGPGLGPGTGPGTGAGSRDLRGALRHATDLIGELRTSRLSPAKYYELYMQVCTELGSLDSGFTAELDGGRDPRELYQLVQHAGNILPRLYLMITVSALLLRRDPEGFADLLPEMHAFCKGVQHPVRGLFVRAYLAAAVRDLLPDAAAASATAVRAAGGADWVAREEDEFQALSLDAADEGLRGAPRPRGLKAEGAAGTGARTAGSVLGGEEGHPGDAVSFCLANFVEMNKLWVRMGFQQRAAAEEDAGSVPEAALLARQQERYQLRMLIGQQLVLLSQLEGVDLEVYAGRVLPSLLEQVLACRDPVAQGYLLESLIAVFPDDFHLATLKPLLSTLAGLSEGVDVRAILCSLLDRFAAWASREPQARNLFENADAFTQIVSQVRESLASTNGAVDLAAAVGLHAALVRFATKCLPRAIHYVEDSFAGCLAVVRARRSDPQCGDEPLGAAAEAEIVTLALAPLEGAERAQHHAPEAVSSHAGYSVMDMIRLVPSYSELIGLLTPRERWRLSLSLLQRAVASKHVSLAAPADLQALLDVVAPLFASNLPSLGDWDGAEGQKLQEAQGAAVSALVKRVHEDGGGMDGQMTLWAMLREASKEVLFKAVPASVHAVHLILASGTLVSGEAHGGTVRALKFLEEMSLHPVMVSGWPQAAIHHCLESARGAHACGELTWVRAFAINALLITEDEVAASSLQLKAVRDVVSCLIECPNFLSKTCETTRPGDGDSGDAHEAECSDAVVTRVGATANRILHPSERCHGVLAYAALFWGPKGGPRGLPDAAARRVARCLERARAAAEASKTDHSGRYAQGYPGLLMDCLETAASYLAKGIPTVSLDHVRQQGQAVEEAVGRLPEGDPAHQRFLKMRMAPHMADIF